MSKRKEEQTDGNKEELKKVLKKSQTLYSSIMEPASYVKLNPGSTKEFLGLFSYEEIEEGNRSEGKTCLFKNCSILKSFAHYKIGDKIETIFFSLDLFLYSKDQEDEQTIYFE